MTKRPGRRPLDPRDPSVQICVSVPSKRYDQLYQTAAGARMTVPELIRQSLASKYPIARDRDPSR